MQPVIIVTDGASDLTPQAAAELGVLLVPVCVIVNGVSYLDRTEISPEEIYRQLKDGAYVTTSQAPLGLFLNVYREALAQAEQVVAIHTSSRLSGIFSTACMAAQILQTDRLLLVDGEQASQSTALLVRKAAQLAAQGQSGSQIVQRIEQLRCQAGLLAYLDSLQYISRGGRVPKLTAWVGDLLSIKPIIAVTDGEAIPIAKARGRKRGQQELLERLAARVGQQPIQVMVGYTDIPEAAAELAQELRARFQVTSLGTFSVGSTIGAHLGPGAYGLVWLVDQE